MKEKTNITITPIAVDNPQVDGVVLRYLGQAGFLIKSRSGKTIVIDPYLTDCVEQAFGFKRMQPPVVKPEDIKPDIVLSTHSHMDHLDIDAFPAFVANPDTFFVGSPDCEDVYKSLGISDERYKILKENENIKIEDVNIRAIYADHGELAPDAVGLLLEIDGVVIYNVGDSGPATERILQSLADVPVDVMIVPINGAFGNLDATKACELAYVIQPEVVIASHFWMFIEHGGDPAAFLSEAKRLGLSGMVMAPGECYLIQKKEQHD